MVFLNDGVLFIDKQALNTSMICSSLLLTKCVLTNFMFGFTKWAGGNRPPEDTILIPHFGT